MNDHFRVTAIVRPTSRYSPSPGVNAIQVVTADFEDSTSLTKALLGQDAIVCCVPGSATKFGPQKLLIDSAIKAGVKLFFASEFVSNILSAHYEIFPTQYVGDKPKIRRYLEEKASMGEIAYTALNGGPFFDMCGSRRLGKAAAHCFPDLPEAYYGFFYRAYERRRGL